MNKDLKTMIASINKKYGDNTIGSVKDMNKLEIERISSGVPYLDWALGGGWPMGRIVEMFGIESSGKTLTCLLTIAQAQKKGMSVALIDAENSFDPIFAKKLGVSVEDLIVSQSSIGETTIDIMLDIIKAKPDLIILDSVAAMVPQTELDNPMEKDTMALVARVMGKALRKITAVNKHSLIIFINQPRSTLSMYGSPTTTPGGRALKHFASIRVQIGRGDLLKEKQDITGQSVKFKIVKNKTAPPFRIGYYNFMYERGSQMPHVDVIESLVSVGILEGIVKRGGAYYTFNDQKVMGKETLVDLLREDEKLYDKLYEEVMAGSRKKNS